MLIGREREGGKRGFITFSFFFGYLKFVFKKLHDLSSTIFYFLFLGGAVAVSVVVSVVVGVADTCR